MPGVLSWPAMAVLAMLRAGWGHPAYNPPPGALILLAGFGPAAICWRKPNGRHLIRYGEENEPLTVSYRSGGNLKPADGNRNAGSHHDVQVPPQEIDVGPLLINFRKLPELDSSHRLGR